MESLKQHAIFGLDSRRSWVVNGFCCWVALTATLSIRSSGVLFVGVVQFFDVTREDASMPMTVQIACNFMGALVFGYLCEVYSCRAVLVTSTLVTSAGISLCYFAPSLLVITIFFGIVHGGTLGGIMVAVNTICTQHFKNEGNDIVQVPSPPPLFVRLVLPPLPFPFQGRSEQQTRRGTFQNRETEKAGD
ncbi:uncharacterized protein ISCGN_028477 [Ixodes scapularis]